MNKSIKHLTPILILAALTLVFFWKIILTNLILTGVDVFLYFAPYKSYAAEALLSGRFPLWNERIFMGVPFLANSQVGLLYPLNWLFLWADAPKQIAYSIGLHIFIAGTGAYFFAHKSLKLSPMAALTGGIVFAFGGFLGAQVEHLNQLQVSAWMPWLFLAFEKIETETLTQRRKNAKGLKTWSHLCLKTLWRNRRRIAVLSFIIALMLLAGHTQSVYIALFGLGLYGIFRRASIEWQTRQWHGIKNALRQSLIFIIKIIPKLISDFLPLVAAIGLSIMLAAAQLLPTAELTTRAIRSGGLSYFEAVSFSLNPLKILYTVFPPFGVNLEEKLGPAFSEFVGYIGIIPLILAAFGLAKLWRKKDARLWGLSLAGLGGAILSFGVYTGPIYLALYWLVPGFNLFRVPARWLLLPTFAAAMLTALGFNRLKNKRWQWLAMALIPLELFVAAQGLRYNAPTAPEAYSSLRPAIAQLQSAENPTDRFLSLSGIVYDPGDLQAIHDIFDDQLPARAVYDYTIAAKQKEVLFFNLPMTFGLNAVDGYDGGLLPLKNFINLERLFLADDNLSPDGRLREKLTTVPEARLLSLLGVRHIITDKVFDVWLNNIFYDLQFPAYLNTAGNAEIWTNDIPTDMQRNANAIGLVFHSPENTGTPVARVTVRHQSGRESEFELQSQVGTRWENAEFGTDFNIVFDGIDATNDPIASVGLTALSDVTVRGVSLIDTENSTSRSLMLTTEGDYRLIHSGDVKIYENGGVLPRAFIVHQRLTVPSADEAVETMKSAAFDPATTIVQIDETIAETTSTSRGTINSADNVRITNYTPEAIRIESDSPTDGWLILTDADYPGWQATIDGENANIFTADIMFRAVELPAGKHVLTFTFKPKSFRYGAIISLLGLIILGFLLIKFQQS